MQTEQVIAALASNGTPVERLPSPVARLITWFPVSLVYAAAIVMAAGLRADLTVKLTQTPFIIEISAAIATSALAAMAAFSASSPGRPLWERLAPIPALVVWLSVLAYDWWQSWFVSTSEAPAFTTDFACFPCIVLLASMPGLLITSMVRRGAPVAPKLTMGLAILAAAALGAAAIRLFHTQDTGLMILVWQVGSVAILALLGASIGRLVLPWPREPEVFQAP